MTKNQSTHRPKATRDKHTIALIVLSIVALVLLHDLGGFGGNIKFYAKWIECGSKPLQSGITYVGRVPHYKESPTLSVLRRSPAYFCTPLEAERAGYSADPNQYIFPHRKKEQERIE